jgi:type II secretory pathway component GspD/PulD (secretin)
MLYLSRYNRHLRGVLMLCLLTALSPRLAAAQQNATNTPAQVQNTPAQNVPAPTPTPAPRATVAPPVEPSPVAAPSPNVSAAPNVPPSDLTTADQDADAGNATPAGGANAPAGGANAPAGGANAPAGGANAPASTVPPPAGAAGATNPEAGKTARPALPTRGTFTITGEANNLSVFSIGVDAQELLTAIAAKANLKLVIDDTVSRRITVNLMNKPARRVVEDIVSAYGFSSAEFNDVLMVSEGIPRSPSSYLLSEIDSIPTKYVDAANARNLLPVFLQDYVKVNSEQNAVVLSAPTEVLRKFREDIARFDIPASQILVDLLVVELTDTTSDQLGLNLLLNNAGEGGESNPFTGNLIFRAISSLPQQFSATLRALQEKGKARVRANPRIATVSGRRASIFVGRQRYIATPIDTGGGQRNFIDAGVRLGMTPYTGGQGQILVEVDAEVSTLSAIDPITRLPEKSTRTANTIVRVGDGGTIVIGGLRQQESREVRTKIPILGDVPFIGSLFRTKDERSTQTELMIFITPRTLSDTGHLPAAEEENLKREFLDSTLKQSLPPAPPFDLNKPVVGPTLGTTPAAPSLAPAETAPVAP